MKKYLYCFFITIVFIITVKRTFAQAPVISYTPATNVYTVNTGITTLSPTNTGGAVTANSLTTFSTDPGSGQPYGIAYDPTTGDIITDAYNPGAVYRYSPSGVLLNTYTTSIQNGGPKDIVVDNSGNIYVANGVGANIVKITPAGVTTTITATGTAFNQPDGMTIDRTTGIIYIADQGTNDVYKLNPGATTATVYKSGFTNLYGVTINSSTGVVYVSEYTPQADVKQIAAGGGTVTSFITKAAGGFSDLRNLDIDAAGDIFVTNYGNNSIDEFSPTGAFIAHVVTGLNSPRATTEDVFGNLYIANSSGGNVEEYSTAYYNINIPLPAGMSFSTVTGQISGTPTVTSPTTVYTIVGHNSHGNGYTTVTITVDPTGPTAPGVSICGAGTATLTATAGAPSGGTFNWYAASSGGTAFASGATYSPTVLTTTTFYVDYTQGGVTCAARTPVTVTVGANPIISTAPTTGAYFSYGFTAGSLSDISGSNNGTQHGTPVTTTDRYSTSGNAYSFVSSNTQYISTTTSYTTPGPQTFSISAWFQTTTAGGYIAGFGSSQTGSSSNVDRVVYIGTNGELYFGVAPSGVKKTINTITVYNDGKWHHVVATFSASNGCNMYVDGALAASDPTMTLVQSYTGYWRVGYDALTGWTNAPTAANTYFNGSLDDIAATTTELTPAQVNVLYGAGSNSTFCAGNALALTANTVSGATYAWVGPSGSGFTSSAQNPTVPAANAIAGIYVLTVTAPGGCTSVINVTAPSNILTSTWSGAAGTTNPTTAGNWDRLPLFNSSTNLVIPTGLSKYPVLTANESIYGLTIATGATLGLGGFNLNVGCNIYNSSGGQILYGSNNASGITWNGSQASQYYYGVNTANTAQTGNLTVNNSAGGTINITGGYFDVYNVLTMVQGSLAVATSPAALTLKSISTAQTASVAAIPAGCAITGNVSVERYIQGSSTSVQKRGYRLLSSAVYTGTVSGINVYDIKYMLNSIYVTGLNGTGNGFNYTSPTNNPSVYLFREDDPPPPSKTTVFRTQYNWKGISQINNSNAYDIGTASRNNAANAADTTIHLPVGNGMLVYYRGNNITPSNGTTVGTKFTTPYNYPESTVTTQIGTLNTGTINVNRWYANAASPSLGVFSYTSSYTTINTWLKGGYACVGNPYASTINWEKYNRNGTNSSIYGTVGTAIYVFNETNSQYEAYMPKTTITSIADTTTSINPGTTSAGASAASNMIASGQGFFVVASGPNQTLSFRETAKTSTQPTSTGVADLMSVGKTPLSFAEAPEPLLRLKLSLDTINTDEIAIRMNKQSSTKFFFNEDALDLGNSGALVSLSAFSSDSTLLSIDYLPYPGKQRQVTGLLVDASSSGTYTLENTELDNLPQLYQAWLKDSFTNDSVLMKTGASYRFTIDKSNPVTSGSNRFSIIIEQDTAFAYKLVSFTATKVPNNMQVQTVWKTTNEQNYTNFTVEHSIDGGKTFSVLGGFPGTGAGSYSLLDKNPVYGQNLYRLKQEDINDSVIYSKVVMVQYDNLNDNNARVQVYPNPSRSTINVSILADANSLNTVRITNSSGSTIKQASAVSSIWQTNISDLLPGTYIIKVYSNKDNSYVGDTKFVKL